MVFDLHVDYLPFFVLQTELAEKDGSIQSLALKISKKSEELSDLSEQLDLFKAKDDENLAIIAELKHSKSPDAAASDADSIGRPTCVLLLFQLFYAL